MKILTIVSDLGRGGTQRVAVDVALCYQRYGHESAVLTRNGSGPRYQDLTEAGIEIFIAQEQTDNPDTPWNQQAKNWNPDIIHLHRTGHHNPVENELIKYFKSNSETPIKIIEHSHFGRCDRGPERNLIDAHIQISKWCLWRWRRWGRGLSNPPIGVYIPHMVHAENFTQQDPQTILDFRDQHHIPRDAFVYGFLAQPHRSKWSPVLFESFKAVAQHDESVYLIIAGISEELKSLYADFPDHIKSRIVVLPFINGDEELQTVYSAMNTFVHSTRIGETFGFILTESMCCHTVVATMENPTRDNAQAEIVGHKRGGVVAANPKALVEAMTILKNDKELLENCQKNGREYVIEQFNQERVSQMLIALLDHVYQSKNSQGLYERLQNDPLLQTNITRKQLQQAGGGKIGSYTLSQRLTQLAVLNPLFQCLIQRYKNIKSK